MNGGLKVIFLKDSFTVVLLGDWNKLYMQPDWIAQNVYEKNEIEIGVSGEGTDLSVSYRSNGVVISPKQSQITMTAPNVEIGTLDYFVNCLNNFLEKAKTPYLLAYGLNCDYVGDDSGVFATTLDSMQDNSSIIELGYEIMKSKVTITLKKGDVVLNLETTMEGSNVRMHFNEHHGDRVTQMPSITVEQVNGFFNACRNLVSALGYEIEEDD